MAENKDAQSFTLYENGPRVSASGSLADALQKKGNAGFINGDTRSSDQVTTLDSLGVARTSEFEQQFADHAGGGRVPGSDPLAGEPGFLEVKSDGNTRPTKKATPAKAAPARTTDTGK
ncbi:MAG TPA: hypothetical protein VFX60_19395 [Micromonospora sp.]|nr:hypothetical protein [Micromonospora sp.]